MMAMIIYEALSVVLKNMLGAKTLSQALVLHLILPKEMDRIRSYHRETEAQRG